MEIVRTSRFSVSVARNLGMRALRPDHSRYVYFLDSDAIPSTGLLKSVRTYLAESDRLLVGRVRWCDRWPPGDFPDPSRGRPVPVRRVLCSAFLGATFLPSAAVLRSAVRFDESIGPGEGTDLKSREDVLFLYRLASASDIRKAVRFPHAYALHPERSRDRSKHVLYARGQGALFARLLRSRMRPDLKASVVGSLLLFLGNALVRGLTFRPSALRILGLRLRGVLEGFRYDAF